MRALLETVLRARLQDPALWELVRSRLVAWTHLLPVVTQWAAVLALTRRVICVLWGPAAAEPCDRVTLKMEREDTVQVELEDDAVLYSWYRVVSIAPQLTHSFVHSFVRSFVGKLFFSLCLIGLFSLPSAARESERHQREQNLRDGIQRTRRRRSAVPARRHLGHGDLAGSHNNDDSGGVRADIVAEWSGR